MLILAATNTIAGVAGTDTAITYSIFGMTLLSGVETYAVLAQGQLASSVGTLYTVPGSTTAFINQIILANTTSSPVTGVSLFANGTAVGNQITGTITIPANGAATIDDDGLAVYDSSGSLQSAIANQTATNLTGTPNLPNGTTATTQTPGSNNTELATTAYTDAAIAAFSVRSSTIQQVTVSLGSMPVKSGTFQISGSGFTPGAQIEVWIYGLRPGGTSTLYDVSEWDQITANGYVVNSTTIQVYWGCRTYVMNSYTFNYSTT